MERLASGMPNHPWRWGTERNEGRRWSRTWSLPGHDNERPRACKRRGRKAPWRRPSRAVPRRIEGQAGPVDQPALGPPGACSAAVPGAAGVARTPERGRHRPGSARLRPAGVDGDVPQPQLGRRRAPGRRSAGAGDSARISWISGRAMATGMPGSPPPDPRSTPYAPLGEDGCGTEAIQDVALPEPCQVALGDHPQGGAAFAEEGLVRSSRAAWSTSRATPQGGRLAEPRPSCFT